MENKTIINVCFATGESYFKYMLTAMVSALKTAAPADRLRFYILCNEVSQTTKRQINPLKEQYPFEVTFIDVNKAEFDAFPSAGAHITNTTYFRYKIAELCPDIDKIIYLDCDTLVMQSLAPLFKQDLAGYYLGGVEDVGYFYWKDHNPNLIYKTDFYINAGVLLINLAAWREQNMFAKLVGFTHANSKKIAIGDQDVINQVCAGKIKPLGYEWNVQDSFYRVGPERAHNPNRTRIEQAALHPAILHYTNFKKPWVLHFSSQVARRSDWLRMNLFSPLCTAKEKLFYYAIKYLFNKERDVYVKNYTFLGLHLRRKYHEK